MSLPSFVEKNNTPSREEAISQIIASIAMEELSLSHVINAEGEKLQYVLGTIPNIEQPDVTIEDILKVNASVNSVLQSAAENQTILKNKLQNVLAASVMQGPTGPIGPTGPQAPFLSCYAEGLADSQNVASGGYISFDIGSVDIVGDNISVNSDGTVFTIMKTGLYNVEWNLNVSSEISGGAVVGILENGEAASGSASMVRGNLSSGTVINVDSVPFTVSLINFNESLEISRPEGWENSAGSIRIIRFADGASV